MTKIGKSRYHVIFSFLLLASCQLNAMNPTNLLIGTINQSNQQLKIGNPLWFKHHNPYWHLIDHRDESWLFGVKSAPTTNFELKKTSYHLAQIHQPKSILLKEYGLLGIEIKDSEIIMSKNPTRAATILKLNLYNRSTQKDFIHFLIEFKQKETLYSLNCYPEFEKSCHYLIDLMQTEKP